MTLLQKQKLSGPGLTRALSVDGIKVVDDTKRIFEVSFASDDVAVLRSNYFDDPWLEVLGCTPDECDLSRVANNSVPVLWGHGRWDRKDHVGITQRAWVANGRCYAEVRLSMRDDLADLWRDIKDGILTNISTGYSIFERVLKKQNKDGPSEYRVTRWQPFEISLVSVPADDTVGIGRSAENQPANFTVTELKDEVRRMDKQHDTPAGTTAEELARDAGKADTPAPAPEKIETRGAPEKAERQEPAAPVDVNAVVAAERSRVASIADLTRDFELGADFERDHVRKGSSVDETRAAALDALRKKQGAEGPRISSGPDAMDKTRAMVEASLLDRLGFRDKDGKGADVSGNEFRGFSMMEMARSSLERSGISCRGLEKMQVAALALGLERGIGHSTSDFPIALGNVFNKVLLAGYNAIPDTWRQLAAVGSVSDFRDSERYRLGTFANLELIPEGGEYTYGSLSDAGKEAIRAATKGKMFAITRQLLINDDIGVIRNILTLMSRGAKRSIEVDVYALLALNSGLGPVMSDAKTLFHADHGNLAASGAAPDITTIAAMSQAMQTQSDGNDYIGITPEIFLSSVAIAEGIKVLNASQYDPESNKFMKPNQVRGLFNTIIGSPRLTGNAWYMFANQNIEPVLEVVFLDGKEEPYTEQRIGWNVDGIEYKIRLDYGVGAVGYRGARRNPGA